MKKKHFTKKQILLTALIVPVLLLSWFIYNKARPESGPGAPGGNVAVAVETAPITTSSISDLGHFTGTLTANSHVTVAPKISGRLNRLLVNIGDPVRSGQLVAVLEDEEYRQQVIQAEADLNVAAANLEEARSALAMAERNLERTRALHQTGIQSDAQLDQVTAQHQAQSARYNVALAQLANREAALESARVRLSYTRISASWERDNQIRYVGERFTDEGALLSTNTPILSIVELQPITAVINVTDRDYFRLQAGQAALVTSTAFPGKSFPGKIARIAPLLQETSRQARVEIEVQNREKLLKPGMFISTRIEFAGRDQVTVVPFNSLANREGLQGVFLVDRANRRARFTPVRIGIIEGDRVEILEPEGISGEVVTLGHYLLELEGGIILPASPEKPADAEKAENNGSEEVKS